MNLRPFALFDLNSKQKLSLVERLLQESSVVVDYEAILKTFETVEESAVSGITSAIETARDDLLGYIEKKFDPEKSDMKFVLQIEIRAWQGVRTEMREAIGAAFVAGRLQFRREATGETQLKVSVTPRAAASYLDDKVFWITGVMRDTLTTKAQAILANAVKSGEAKRDTMKKLFDLFAPYVGQTVDEKVVTPARLETIIRTNVTDAYNQGRLTEINDPDVQDLIEGVRYSAVLDERTTEVCSFLHEKVFRSDDPNLDRLAPPNHYNCRSVLVPVVIGEEVGEFAGEAEINKALSMVRAGFGGDIAELSQQDRETKKGTTDDKTASGKQNGRRD